MKDRLIEWLSIISCALVHSLVMKINNGILLRQNPSLKKIFCSDAMLIVVFVFNIISYLVLIKLYEKAFFFITNYDVSKNYGYAISLSYFVFTIWGVVMLIFNHINPDQYSLFVFGKVKNGKNALLNIATPIIAAIQAFIIIIIYNKREKHSKTELLVDAIKTLIIVEIVHIPNIFAYWGIKL